MIKIFMLIVNGLLMPVTFAFGQLSLVSTMDNPTWQGLYNPPSNQVLYQYPAAVCACKILTDPAPASIYGILPSVFVVDSFHSDFVFHFWSTGSQDFGYQRYSDNFSVPGGIIAFSNGDVYVSDTNNNRLVKLNLNTNVVTAVSQSGSQGYGPGQFYLPMELSEDAEGNIYVADTGNNRIQKFDRNFNPINSFIDQRPQPEVGNVPVNFIGGYMGTGNEQMAAPLGVAVNLSNDDIYVADTGNKRILHFDKFGNVASPPLNLINSGLPGVSSNPVLSYMDIDQKGRLYIVDESNDTLYVFDNNLNYLFPTIGNPSSPIYKLRGVSVEKSQDSSGNNFTHGNIYVTDQGRLQTFSLNFDITNLSGPASVFEGPTSPAHGCFKKDGVQPKTPFMDIRNCRSVTFGNRRTLLLA